MKALMKPVSCADTEWLESGLKRVEGEVIGYQIVMNIVSNEC